MGGSDGTGHDPAQAIGDVTCAIERALTLLRAGGDALPGFHHATRLWAVLRTAIDTNGELRAVLAAQVAIANPDESLGTLAEMLSTPGHRVRKARAGELIATGRARLAGHPAAIMGSTAAETGCNAA